MRLYQKAIIYGLMLSTVTDALLGKFSRRLAKTTKLQLHGYGHLVDCVKNPLVLQVDPAMCQAAKPEAIISAFGADMFEQSMLLGVLLALFFTLKRSRVYEKDFDGIESESDDEYFEETIREGTGFSRKCPQCNGLGSLPWVTGGPMCELCDGAGSVNVPPRPRPLNLPPTTRGDIFDS